MDFNNAIVAGIGGTESWKYRNCHVKNFCIDFGTTHKQYFRGPEIDGGGIFTTCAEVVDFVSNTNKKIGGPVPICLVGHSRGGMIAINAAIWLESYGLHVHYLGLYDAVDRAIGMDGKMIRNVSLTYHALRSPLMESREWFGNTCVANESTICHTGGDYRQKKFMTSHGGVGGDPITTSGQGGDQACVPDQAVLRKMFSDNYDLASMCESQSRAADNWIRQGAMKKGLPISVR